MPLTSRVCKCWFTGQSQLQARFKNLSWEECPGWPWCGQCGQGPKGDRRAEGGGLDVTAENEAAEDRESALALVPAVRGWRKGSEAVRDPRGCEWPSADSYGGNGPWRYSH